VNQNISAQQFYAEIYDATMSDWPGEMDFYREIVSQEVNTGNGAVLDLACGTGRIALRLAEAGTHVVGLDHSPYMLAIARQKSAHTGRITWVEADMRAFELGEKFDLALIPSHSFQNLNNPEDQFACLACIWRHLKPGGALVIHLDHMGSENMAWLGEISQEAGKDIYTGEQLEHPKTGLLIRQYLTWSYEPASQTAIKQTIWEEVGKDGALIRRLETGEVHLHVVFRFEMEHLLERTGFEVEGIYGDFDRQELQDDSSHLIWVARRPCGTELITNLFYNSVA
jgi:ubiquinone/menaquinone biosynthesis C-methylase UbiE